MMLAKDVKLQDVGYVATFVQTPRSHYQWFFAAYLE
jgi:hypothetical protein